MFWQINSWIQHGFLFKKGLVKKEKRKRNSAKPHDLKVTWIMKEKPIKCFLRFPIGRKILLNYSQLSFSHLLFDGYWREPSWSYFLSDSAICSHSLFIHAMLEKVSTKAIDFEPNFFFFCIYGFLRIWSVFIPQKPDMIYVDVMGFFSGLLYVIFANEFPMSCWLNKKWKQEKYSRFCKRGTYRGSHLPWRGNRRIRHRASDHQCIDIDLWNQVRDKQIVPFGLPSVGILKCKPKSVGIPGLYSSTVLYSSKAHIHSFFWAFHEAL